MLVERPEFIQLPKGVIPKGIPSVIWLKVVDKLCHCGWKKSESVPVGGVIGPENKETNLPFFFRGENPLSIEMGETPSQLIESRPKIADKIPEQHRNRFRRQLHRYPPNLHCPVKICFMGDSIGWKVEPLIELDLKSFEMFL